MNNSFCDTDRRILANEARRVWNELSAEDGGLTGVCREWQDEAALWQAAETDENIAAAVALVTGGNMLADTLRESMRWAVAAIHEQAWYTEAARRAEEEFEARRDLAYHVEAVAAAVGEALRITFDGSLFSSRYARKRGLKLRVSDHCQKPGGGWNEGTGERNGEAHVQWVISSTEQPIPTREQIRAKFLAALLDQ